MYENSSSIRCLVLCLQVYHLLCDGVIFLDIELQSFSELFQVSNKLKWERIPYYRVLFKNPDLLMLMMYE